MVAKHWDSSEHKQLFVPQTCYGHLQGPKMEKWRTLDKRILHVRIIIFLREPNLFEYISFKELKMWINKLM
jgi:hypothetical protein